MFQHPKVWPISERLYLRPHTRHLSDPSLNTMLTDLNIDIVFNLDKTTDARVAGRVPTVQTVPSDNKRQWLWDTASAVVHQIKAGRTVLLHDDARMDRAGAVSAVVRRLIHGEAADLAVDAVTAAQPKIVWSTGLKKMVADAPAPEPEVEAPEVTVQPMVEAAADGPTPRRRRRRHGGTRINGSRALQMLRSVEKFIEQRG